MKASTTAWSKRHMWFHHQTTNQIMIKPQKMQTSEVNGTVGWFKQQSICFQHNTTAVETSCQVTQHSKKRLIKDDLIQWQQDVQRLEGDTINTE
jgi:hypothetical protein